MKKLAKVLSLALVLVMVLSLGGTAWADPDPTHTITVYNTKNKDGSGDTTQIGDTAHVYSAYKIFSGALNTTTNQLENLAYADTKWEQLPKFIKENGDNSIKDDFTDDMTAALAAAKMGEYTSDSDKAKALAKVIGKFIDDKSIAAAGTSTQDGTDKDKYTISVTGDGYYFIKDTTSSLPAGDTRSLYMLQVVGDVTIKAKKEVPSSQKKVKDKNDSEAASSTNPTDWQDSADWDIGDHVPFQLTGTVASDYDEYTEYKFVFHDKQSNGLTFEKDTVKVYVADKELASSAYSVKNTGLSDGCTFEIEIEDLKALTKANLATPGEPAADTIVHAGSIITAEYTSVLNKGAVIGGTGNPNEMQLEFSNNPNDTTETNKTPKDTVIVFTYKVVVNKVDGSAKNYEYAGTDTYADLTAAKADDPAWEANPDIPSGEEGTKSYRKLQTTYLNGADFELYKVTNSDLAGSITDSTTIDDDWFTTNEDKLTPINGNGSTDAPSKTISANGSVGESKFTFSGLDDGVYVLRETATPAGYNAIKPQVFEVTATHKTTDDNPGATTLESLTGNKISGEITLTAVKANGELDTDVINRSGNVLPTTGGVGTTLFYVFGSMLVIAAAVYFVTKKRSEVE